MGAHFIIGVNPGGNPSLFEWLKGIKLNHPSGEDQERNLRIEVLQ